MKLTQKHFTEFKAECEKWIDIIGLVDWRITYSFVPLEDNFAQINIEFRDCVATITLNSDVIDYAKNHLDLKGTAKHEVIHLLLSRLHGMALERFIDQTEIDNEWERLVRILEKVID